MTAENQSYASPILYYLPTCPHCHKVIDFIERHGIQGIEMANVEDPKNAQELVDVSGQDGVPVFYFNGKYAIGDEQCISMISTLVMNNGKMD